MRQCERKCSWCVGDFNAKCCFVSSLPSPFPSQALRAQLHIYLDGAVGEGVGKAELCRKDEVVALAAQLGMGPLHDNEDQVRRHRPHGLVTLAGKRHLRARLPPCGRRGCGSGGSWTDGRTDGRTDG